MSKQKNQSSYGKDKRQPGIRKDNIKPDIKQDEIKNDLKIIPTNPHRTNIAPTVISIQNLSTYFAA